MTDEQPQPNIEASHKSPMLPPPPPLPPEVAKQISPVVREADRYYTSKKAKVVDFFIGFFGLIAWLLVSACFSVLTNSSIFLIIMLGVLIGALVAAIYFHRRFLAWGALSVFGLFLLLLLIAAGICIGGGGIRL